MSYVTLREKKEVIYEIRLDKETVSMTKEGAEALFDELSHLLHPNLMKQGRLDCNDRYSHSPHAEVKNGIVYLCRGRSFDAT